MNIDVDISFFPDHLIPIITNSAKIKPFYVKNYQVSNQDSTAKFSVFEFPGSIKEFEDLLNSLLQKNSINEYVVIQDMETENTLTLLKTGDIEQLGILICDFCGAAFNSEDEKYIHQRAHYFF
ncbi:MAG: hypothetical protein H0X03_03505 [Nitrosopumilus sp.]|nr:hypothetical protein [Nitrosopumilus sp.]